jgi:TonB family protein
METVGPLPADDELHLLYEWRDPFTPARQRTAGIASILAHVAFIVMVGFLPADFLEGTPPEPPPPPKKVTVTPLYAPPMELTQKEPNKGKISHEIDLASLQPRERIAPPTRPAPARPAQMGSAPAPPPKPAALPEPPKIEAAVRDEPKLELPPSNATVAPPQNPTVANPKLVLENVGAPPPPVPPGQSKVPVPNTSVAEAIRQNVHPGAPGGVVVGDPGAAQSSPGLELKSDAMGVDFRPYLAQILTTIRRNWEAVYPESARLGRRGKVGLMFIISKAGRVDKVTWAYQSGAEALDRAAVAAISASNPFPPLPADFKGERVVLQLNFAYNMPKQ